jgi:hypothetical protein
MAKRLRNLKINEISLVDRPANLGARVLLAKRDDNEGKTMTNIDIGKATLEVFNILAAQLRRRDPSLTKEQAFTKVYSDPANAELRRIERNANSFVRYPSADTHTESSVTSAYDQLRKLSEEVRRDHPGLSPQQAFAKAYQENRELAQREREAAYARLCV